MSFFLCSILSTTERENLQLGVWISVFSSGNVLASKTGADNLIDFCSENGITDVYLQIYRSDKAYYDSKILPRETYTQLKESFGEDPIDYIIDLANSRGLRVHLWINALSLAQNKNAYILEKYGDTVLTFDQHGRTPHVEKEDYLDNYYIREKQLFLEPGNEKVINHVVRIAEEITLRYPDSYGLQLDYIRYPMAVPFIPGSRFTQHGLSYGYNEENIKSFLNKTGIDASAMDLTRKKTKAWDDHRRDNVTHLIREISRVIDRDNFKLSCTTVPSIEKSYMVTLQDWTTWLKEELVDEVIFMNYTDDSHLAELYAKSLSIEKFLPRLVMGLGPYLFDDDAKTLKKQIDASIEAGFEKIAFFAYDHLLEEQQMRRVLKDAKGN